MRVKLTATAIWQVAPEDENLANDILKNQPADTVIDYLQDAVAGDKEISLPKATAELLED